LDPLTAYKAGATYNTASLVDFLTLGGTNSSYNKLFTNPAYSGVTPYAAQNTTTVLNKLVSLYSHAYNDSLSSVTKSAAFQYAVWEIEGESAYSSTSGGLKTATTGGFKTQVDAYLTALTNNTWTSVNGANLSATKNYTYTAYVSSPLGGSQTFLRVTDAPNTVPEPGSIALVSLALFGVAYTRRSKRS
ncbi:MAG: PEP-CTERM sorting domain-containing protein, partial [Burkholderiaceae bacterium]|nr:PEP-CTERM sorting domain-containing protein [Burkholderiaceae bacterium]